MGLAEPRRKTKMSFDPNNTTWGEDTSKFGYQLMNKMGWQEGQGLGRNKDGSKDHIKVRVKNNALGVGAKKGHDDNWLELQASFNNLLENLVQSHEQGIDNSNVKVSKLEEKANASRRIFYSRFVKSKDVSKYSSSDMASIFGERAKSEASPSPGPDDESGKSECTFTGVTTTTNSMSINDYFAQRLAERRAAMGGGATAQATDSVLPSEAGTPNTLTESETDSATASGEDVESSQEKRKKKEKKSKKEKVEGEPTKKSKKEKKGKKGDEAAKEEDKSAAAVTEGEGKGDKRSKKARKADAEAEDAPTEKSKKSKKEKATEAPKEENGKKSKKEKKADSGKEDKKSKKERKREEGDAPKKGKKRKSDADEGATKPKKSKK